MHMRKECFPAQRRSELCLKGDGPFQIFEKINDNADELDLPNEYDVSATFSVANLSFSHASEISGWILLNRNYENHVGQANNDHLHVLDGPITRSKVNKIKKVMQWLVQTTWAENSSGTSERQNFKVGIMEEPTLLHLIQVKDEGVFFKNHANTRLWFPRSHKHKNLLAFISCS